MRLSWHRSVGICSVILVAGACKPQPQEGAQVQSLDNLTRADGAAETHNVCTGDNNRVKAPADRVDLSQIPDESTRVSALQAIGRSLTAVPEAHKAAFFKFANLQLLPKVTAASCTGNAFASQMAQDQELAFCWVQRNGRLTAVVKADPAVIEHQIVRMFAYLAIDIVGPIIDGFDASARSAHADAVAAHQFIKRRAETLTEALLDDAKQNAKLNVKAIKNAFASGDARKKGIAARQVLAEAFNSAHCSDATRATFAKSFKQTHNAYFDRSLNLDPPAPAGDDVEAAFSIMFAAMN